MYKLLLELGSAVAGLDIHEIVIDVRDDPNIPGGRGVPLGCYAGHSLILEGVHALREFVFKVGLGC